MIIILDCKSCLIVVISDTVTYLYLYLYFINKLYKHRKTGFGFFTNVFKKQCSKTAFIVIYVELILNTPSPPYSNDQ